MLVAQPIPKDKILAVRLAATAGATTRELAERFALHEVTIRKLVTGAIYPDAGGPIRQPRRRLAPGTSPAAIAEEGRCRLLGRREVTVAGCWHWTGALSQGYGQVRLGSRKVAVHRLAWELFVGPIPPGLVIDHMCHNEDTSCAGGAPCQHRRCFNPGHLRVVDQASNTRAGRAGAHSAAKTHCPSGHEYNDTNTMYVNKVGGRRRRCRICNAAQWARWQAQR